MTNLHWDPRMFTGSPPGIHRVRAARRPAGPGRRGVMDPPGHAL